MDDHHLKCNILKCRAELGQRALVVTCSHIFCLDCADRSGLTNSDQRRACPVCRASLPNPDDAVIANLTPTEDYKTSVLSGLSPSIIMECAGRALGFWAYQMTQEIVYQNYLGKNITERYSSLSIHLDKVISDANSEIAHLQNKIANMTLDHDTLKRKNDELLQAFKEKNRKLLQTQELYDKLKRKAMLGQVQDAALDAADSTLRSNAESANLYTDRSLAEGYDQHQLPNMPPYGVVHSHDRFETSPGSGPSNPPVSRADGGWPRPIGSQDIPPTPSTHRQRLEGPSTFGPSTVPGLGVSTPLSAHGSGRIRQPLNVTQPTITGTSISFPGVGLSSGAKTSHPEGHTGGFMPSRPRGEQQILIDELLTNTSKLLNDQRSRYTHINLQSHRNDDFGSLRNRFKGVSSRGGPNHRRTLNHLLHTSS